MGRFFGASEFGANEHPIDHVQLPVAASRDIGFMGDDDQALLLRTAGEEQIQHLVRVFSIEVSCRLIAQQDARGAG